MPNMKSSKPALFLAAAFLAGPACSLPAPTHKGGGGSGAGNDSDECTMAAATGGMMGAIGGSGTGGNMTVADDLGGANGQGGAGGASSMGGIDTIITPMSCAGIGPKPNAIDAYSQGYTPDPAVLAQVKAVLTTMSLHDEATQMRGVAITPTKYSYSDMQRSEDTSAIRGFRYRDASRGVDLGEDFSGTYPRAGMVGKSNVGYSTAFPVSMARGAAFDLDLEYAIGEAIGDEMQATKETVMLAPCMNLLRHPLWGRAQETYGEDSYQIGRLASALTVGIQQHVLANAKHYMAYDIENNRAANNSNMDEQTLREVYGRHFRMVVQDSGVGSVMASYNLVNNIKATQSAHMLTDILRSDFGFNGFVLSDWWAMPNTVPKDVDATTAKRTAIQAVKAGLDVELPWGINYGQLENIVNSNGGLTKADIDVAAARVLEQKFRFNSQNLTGNIGLGASRTRYRKSEIICNDDHIMLAQKAAVESMVLLKNDNNTLPIKSTVHKIAVLGVDTVFRVTDGASSDSTRPLNFATDVLTGDLGSSRVFHNPAKGISPFEGIKAAMPNADVVHGTTAAEAADADFVVVVAGLTPQDEGEEYTKAGDRENFELDGKQKDPKYAGLQNALINAVAAMGKPMVVVLEGGSVISMPWLSSVPAVVMAWYPGQHGGAAMGQLLSGQANFGGKLPFSWGKQLSDYPQFNGNGTTTFDFYVGYHYFDHSKIAPLFPFGYGLSYTTFEYRKLQLGCSDMSKGAVLPVVVNVANTGSVEGDEIVMAFVSFPGTKGRRFDKELKGFTRVHLAPGEEKQVTIQIRLSDLDYFQQDSTDVAPAVTSGKWIVESGDVKIMVGGSSTSLPLTGTVTVNGYDSGPLK